MSALSRSRSDEGTDGRSGRDRGPVATIVASCLTAALCLALLPAAASAAKVTSFSWGMTKSQSKVAGNGKVDLQFAVGGVDSPTFEAKVSVSVKQAWSKAIQVAGSGFRKYQAKSKTSEARVSLSGAALDLVRNCGTPTLAATLVVKADGKTVTRKISDQLRPDGSRCAISSTVQQALNRSAEEGCDFIAPDGNACLGPFPNDFYTRPDETSETGVRVDIDPNATPINKGGDRVAVDQLNLSDGFSAGPLLSVYIPGMNNQEAFDESGLVPLAEMSKTYAANPSVVLIDAETGERQLIWSEIDATSPSDAERHLLIRVGKNLENGKRYIVALRNLKTATGQTIQPPAAFRLYRDGKRTKNSVIEARRPKFESIFRTLADEGIGRKSLYLAWDFTVASTENITGRMLSIRDRAFATLGDTNLTDGTVQGAAPQVEITQVFSDETNDSLSPVDRRLWSGDRGPARDQLLKIVEGRITVPCYLWRNNSTPGCNTGAKFKLDEDQKPIRGEGSTYQARFSCNIPKGVIGQGPGGQPVVNPVKTSLYGHGLFGEHWEAPTSRNVRQLGFENDVMVCATDWIGMSDEDVAGAAVPSLVDLTNFPKIADRLQQGFLNWLFLGRAIIHSNGLAVQDAFKVDPDGAGPAEAQSVIDRSGLYYYGNSQGGIAGGALTSVATDFTRSVLYVGAINYSTLLSRSVDWPDYAFVLYNNYLDPVQYPVIFSLMQMMWDRGEPNGYANHMTSDPLPNTPAHKVMYSMAYGDFQVANVATEVSARTIGAPLRLPTVAPERLTPGLIEPFYGHETLGDLAASADARNGNAFFVWDLGPKRTEDGRLRGTEPPPITNLAPDVETAGLDPHDRVIENSPIIRKQIVDFLRGGTVTDPCTTAGTTPYCTAMGWQGMP